MCVHLNYIAPALADQACECICQSEEVHTHPEGVC